MDLVAELDVCSRHAAGVEFLDDVSRSPRSDRHQLLH